jgi:fumarate reductase subunit D
MVRPMERHREPLAALLAAAAVFLGIVAPVLMLVLAVVLTCVGLAALVMGAGSGSRTVRRRGVQNPH